MEYIIKFKKLYIVDHYQLWFDCKVIFFCPLRYLRIMMRSLFTIIINERAASAYNSIKYKFSTKKREIIIQVWSYYGWLMIGGNYEYLFFIGVCL